MRLGACQVQKDALFVHLNTRTQETDPCELALQRVAQNFDQADGLVRGGDGLVQTPLGLVELRQVSPHVGFFVRVGVGQVGEDVQGLAIAAQRLLPLFKVVVGFSQVVKGEGQAARPIGAAIFFGACRIEGQRLLPTAERLVNGAQFELNRGSQVLVTEFMAEHQAALVAGQGLSERPLVSLPAFKRPRMGNTGVLEHFGQVLPVTQAFEQFLTAQIVFEGLSIVAQVVGSKSNFQVDTRQQTVG